MIIVFKEKENVLPDKIVARTYNKYTHNTHTQTKTILRCNNRRHLNNEYIPTTHPEENQYPENSIAKTETL